MSRPQQERAGRPLWSAALVALCAGTAAAHAARDDAAPRTARAVRVATPPRIDGKLDDPVWRDAPPIGELVQVEPREGAAPSERTEVRFLYDAHHLYIGLRFYDSRPDELISSSKERDAFLDEDDRFELIIDTFHDGRSAFWFQINPAGSKSDALITANGNDFNKPWDGIWESACSTDELGWSTEMAIPFKTLNFHERSETWGFNIKRHFGRLREEARWATPDQDRGFFSVAHAGDLEGIRDISQGIGLDVVPFFVGNLRKDDTGGGDTDLLGEPGLDAYYKVTPNLTLSMTVNTDFAETEVDERQINLTRFPLFFPERRDFFLQDSGLFAFTGLRAFFSRRIGLTDGDEVPIVTGAKLTGRVGDTNIGLLDVLTDSVDATSGPVEEENDFVGRITHNVGRQSSIGAIVTHGNPGSDLDNTVYGVDTRLRTSEFLGDRTLEATAWFLESATEGPSGDDQAFGASLDYPNDLWSWRLSAREVGSEFDAGLGFVPRRGIRQYTGFLSFEPRPGTSVRQLELELQTVVTTDQDDVLESWESELQPFGIAWESGEQLRLEYEHVHDELRAPFTIFSGDAGPTDDITLAVDDYDYDRLRLEFASGRQRPLAVDLALTSGTFFDGHRTDLSAILYWRQSALFTGSAEWTQSDVDLDGGDFQTQLARLRARFSFSPALSWNTFAQWDNLSERIGINSRLRYIPSPGHEVFLVFNETLNEAGRGLAAEFQELALKVSYTLRF